MPEHLRALVVVLALATVVFAFAKAQACAVATGAADFERRRNLWYAITLIVFLSHNYWVYIVLTAVVLLVTLPGEPNKLAAYFLVLFAVPPIADEISGLGVVNYFFTIHYIRLLALAVLLPAFLYLAGRPGSEPFGRLLPDKLLAGYIILRFALMFPGSSFTDALRHGVFYAFIDIFLPYYVTSRSLKNLQGMRDALMSFVVAALVLSAIGVFEYAKAWLLYKPLEHVLGVGRWGYGNYLPRGESLRALASTGQPIVLGYVIAVAMGFFLFVRRLIPSAIAWALALTLLLAGLIAPVSRGPWVGAVAMLLVFVATGPFPVRGFAKLGLIGLVVVPALLASPAGDRIIDLLPFVGTVEEQNVTYRQRFTEISIETIARNPFFGDRNYVDLEQMDELKPQGLLDTLNVFLTVALGNGLVGLTLFAGFFIAVAFGIFRGMMGLADKNGELRVLGRALFSTLIGIVVIINTVSPILFIPVIYWTVAGIGVAYARMLASEMTSQPERPADLHHRAFKNGSHLQFRK
jgi:hypothetical protein